MIGDFIGGLIHGLVRDTIGCLLGWTADFFTEGKRAKSAQRDVFIGGLRVQSGSQQGLTREWLAGEWSIRRGRMSMGGVDVVVKEIVTGSRRPASLNEFVGGQDSVVVLLRTQTAVLEWSMLRRFDGLALRALGVPGSATAP